MKARFLLGAGIAALIMPGVAAAQSTGTQVFEQGDIVVSGQRDTQVAGTKIPDSGKTKVELTQEFLSHETAGQSVDEMINMLPGVSFNNYDGYGSSGGSLTIRGFDASRILQTIDGVPINDTGNYAIYSSEQVDPELIDQVNVSLGSVDIDSPSASASGSTVNYTTITPTDKFGARLEGSIGDQNMFRVFGVVNTGIFTPWGTKAWVSASNQDYNVVFNPIGKIRRSQYNAKIYQPIGSNGDFIAIAGNYNVTRNNNTADLYYDTFPLDRDERALNLSRCTVAAARPGLADVPNSCGTNYAESLNISNNGNVRLTSLFHLADNLILTVNPTFQYVKANGGSSTITGYETAEPGTGALGYLSYTDPKTHKTTSNYYFGEDLNGDGDTLDQVKLYAPSQTVTHRYTLTTSLQWNIANDQSIRLAYAHDYGRHRQSGEVGYLQDNGQAVTPSPINDPIAAANGALVEKRNRKSFAILDKVGAEYRGKFFDDKLTIDAGGSYVMEKRNLHQYCFTTGANGYVDCVAGDADDMAAYATAHPTFQPPVSASLTYNKFLPSANVTYKFDSAFQFYASYSKGIQVPGTDNLYQALYFYGTDQFVNPTPETTDNFDAGIRYTTSKIQAQVGPWLTIFQNRLGSSYDPITDTTTYRNLGTVHKYGIDGSIAYQPIRQVSLYVFGSYLKSKILHNIDGGNCSTSLVGAAPGCTTATIGQDFEYLTAGKRESGSPVYTFGGRAEVNIDPVKIGVEAKRTGRRYLNDQNLDLIYKGADLGDSMPAYTVVNLDARVNLAWMGFNNQTYFQFNVTNLFDSVYAGSSGGGLAATNDPFTYIGAPRTLSGTINVAF